MRVPESCSISATSPAESRKFTGTATAPQLQREIAGDRVFGGADVEGHPVTGAHTQVRKRLGEAPHTLVPFAVGPAAGFIHERGMLGVALDGLLEQRSDVHDLTQWLLQVEFDVG